MFGSTCLMYPQTTQKHILERLVSKEAHTVPKIGFGKGDILREDNLNAILALEQSPHVVVSQAPLDAGGEHETASNFLQVLPPLLAV
jgi:hypothetical protein